MPPRTPRPPCRPPNQPRVHGPALRLPVVDVLQHVLQARASSRSSARSPTKRTVQQAPLRGRQRSVDAGCALQSCGTSTNGITAARSGGSTHGLVLPGALQMTKENWAAVAGVSPNKRTDGYENTKALLVRLLQTQWAL